MSNPRVRIAPSPTGSPQIGNARTALFNYLFAKHEGGSLVLRIEDTDLERSDKKYENEIFQGLQWLGIDPDEGPQRGGPYAPYRQTERTATYTAYLDRLFAAGRAFYCFHTKQELAQERQRLLTDKLPPLHQCEYRTMETQEARHRAASNPDHVIRFKTPLAERVSFPDLIRGELSFATDLLGDFSIARNRAAPLYHFAVVVDDIEMKITHVIRGEEHIPNTPKHILLFEALGASIPAFAHLPLILAPDRSKLSKRHGATSLADYQRRGYLPEAMINFIALLGWNPGGNQEIFSKQELVDRFSLEKIQKSGAIFDFQKLDWMNGEYIRKTSVPELTKLCLPFLNEFLNAQLPSNQFPRALVESVVALEQPRLKKLSEIGERSEFFFRAPKTQRELLIWKKMGDQELRAALSRAETLLAGIPEKSAREHIEKVFFDAIGRGDKGELLWPLRAALSGKKASPGPFEIIEIIGIPEAIARIRAAMTAVQA